MDWKSFVYFMLNEKNCRESSKQQQNVFVISRCAAAYFIIKAVWKDLKKKKADRMVNVMKIALNGVTQPFFFFFYQKSHSFAALT